MKNHVLIFLDHKGNERFFLRFNGTPTELQIWLERLNARPESDTDWDSIRWEYS
ncbi:MAG TPA: hypothetical protein VHY59_13690 [Chthoniobacterales bacterium]|nr:hypothetical protein [Chthoniobacterales bacterium]